MFPAHPRFFAKTYNTAFIFLAIPGKGSDECPDSGPQAKQGDTR
jgi:hypothetical protein